MPGHDPTEAELERERRELAIRLDILSGRLTAEHLAGAAGEAAAGMAAQAMSGAWAVGRRAAGQLAVAAVTRTGPEMPAARTRNIHPKGDNSMTDTIRKTDTLTDTAEAVGAKAKATVERLRTRIDDGLETLPEAARERVRKARRAAIAAQAEVEARARETASAARQTARENPLLVGALALAAGAAVAALLPRTSVENRTLGAHRDRLFDEAERIYKEERARLSAATAEAIEDGAQAVEDRMQTDAPSHKSEDATA